MPTGQRLTEGFSTTITFAEAPGIAFWEMGVTPPGADGGGENDTTTMRNLQWRTRQPKSLRTLTPLTGTCAYDPKVYTDIMNQLNNNQLITVRFSNGATLAFWGWLNEFRPNEIVEGAMPTATFTIIPGNMDNTGLEVAPLYTAGAATTTATTTTLA